MGIGGAFYLKYFFWIVVEVATLFIAQVGVGATFANHFYWVVHVYSAVIGSDNQIEIVAAKFFEHLGQARVFEPANR